MHKGIIHRVSITNIKRRQLPRVMKITKGHLTIMRKVIDPESMNMSDSNGIKHVFIIGENVILN